MSRYADLMNRFSATPTGTWLVRHFASKVDPMIYRMTRGRFTSTGRPTLPMLSLTVRGRRSGQPRTVQLAYVREGDDLLVVASAMGQERHPAWSHNLEAAERAQVQLGAEVFPVDSQRLTEEEKAPRWPAIVETIPQMTTYARRTDRRIRVYRLSPSARADDL